MRLSDEDKRNLSEHLNKRVHDTLLSVLQKRKDEHIKVWQSNLDESLSANLRGRVCEDDELIKMLKELVK